MNLSDDERLSLLAVLEGVGRRTGQSITFESLIDRWNGFVTEVEGGYRLTGYDYANDLGTRDVIEEILLAIAPSVREKAVEGGLGAADQRFLAATRVANRSLTLGGGVGEAFWWWKRVPKDLSGELASDLVTE